VAQTVVKKKERSTLSAGDWEQQALEMIAEKGIRAVAVESLARRMGVTKGSFYWHFQNRDSLLEQSLLRWEKHDEANLQSFFGGIADPRDRLRSFFRLTGQEKLTHNVYNALCSAADHPQVELLLERVAERRMKHIETAFTEIPCAFDLLDLPGVFTAAKTTPGTEYKFRGIRGIYDPCHCHINSWKVVQLRSWGILSGALKINRRATILPAFLQ